MTHPLRLSSTHTVIAQLRLDQWVPASAGPSAHAQFTHPIKPGRISLDLSEPLIPTATLRSIYRRANWDW